MRPWTLLCGTSVMFPLPARFSKPAGLECGEKKGAWQLLCPWGLPAHSQPLNK